MEENSKELKEKLFNKKELGWNSINDREKEAIYTFSNGYMNFLNKAKIEREFVISAKEMAEQNGFRDITKCEFLKPGDKVYYINRDKSMYLAVIGTEKLENGLQIVGAHIDSPRMDIKQNPLYESNNMAYLDTHYYGGIKKYQWVTLPLAIHGVVVKKDGTKVEVNIGEKDTDPVFCVTDLLIHLAGQQMEKNAAKVIEGENLDILVGSIPLEDKEKDAVKTYEKVLILDANNLQANIFLGNYFYLQAEREKKKLEDDYKKITSPTRMQYARYRNGLSDVYSNGYSKAKDYLQRVLQLFPSTEAGNTLEKIKKLEIEIK